MATQFTGATDHHWSVAGNWSAGKPDSADAVTVAAGVTEIHIDETASCLSFDTTGATGNVAISGAGAFTVYGDFTLASGDTWTHTGVLTFSTNACAVNTAGIAMTTVSMVFIAYGADVTLGSALNIGTKALYFGDSGISLNTAGYQIDCGTFGDGGASGSLTLTLSSSTINCTNVSFQYITTLTVSDNTATINITTSAITLAIYLKGVAWGTGGDTTFVISATGSYSALSLYGANTLGNLTVGWTTEHVSGNVLKLYANQTISGTFTVTGASTAKRPTIKSDTDGTARTITAGTVTITGAVDFRYITGAGAGSWDLSAINSGNAGGCSGITFRSAANYYLACTSTPLNWSADVFSTTDDGTPNGTGVFPLPQDTVYITNSTWGSTGNTITCEGGRLGAIDASGLTEDNTINFDNSALSVMGSLILTGSGITASIVKTVYLDALLGNVVISYGKTNLGGAITVGTYSGTNTVSLGTNITISSSGTFTLDAGTFDLNGYTLTIGAFSSSGSTTRALQDTPGGGKIILLSTNTVVAIWNMFNATGLTVDDAPDIQIGDGTLTYTGNMTFRGGGKTYGDFTAKKHAGNYDIIIA